MRGISELLATAVGLDTVELHLVSGYPSNGLATFNPASLGRGLRPIYEVGSTYEQPGAAS